MNTSSELLIGQTVSTLRILPQKRCVRLRIMSNFCKQNTALFHL